MANKLCDSQGQLIGYIETVEKNMHDGLTRVILHTGHELTFLQGDLIADRGGNLSIRYGGLNAGKKSTLLLRPQSFTGRMVPRPL